MKLLSLLVTALALAACSSAGDTDLAPTSTAGSTSSPGLDVPTPSLRPPSPSPTASPTTRPTPLGGAERYLTFSRNDSEPGGGSFITVSVEGSDQRVLIQGSSIADSFEFGNAYVSQAFIAPNGSTFALVLCRVGDCSPTSTRLLLFTQDFSQSADVPLPGRIHKAEWTLDGSKLLLTIDPGGPTGARGFPIYLVDADSNSFGSITRFGDASAAFWSAEGEQVYYYHYVSDRSSLFVSRLDGSDRRGCEECPLAGFSYNGAASPDGKRIAFSAGPEVFIASADFGSPTVVPLATRDPGTSSTSLDLQSVAWSPDGQILAVEAAPEIGASTYGPVQHIWIVAATGTTALLVEDTGSLSLCGWTPDSKTVVYWSDGLGIVLAPINPGATPSPLPVAGDSCPLFLK